MPPKLSAKEAEAETGAESLSHSTPTPPTLRHRHGKRSDASDSRPSAATPTTVAPSATTTTTTPSKHAGSNAVLKNVCFCVIFVVVSFCLLALAFLGLQVVAVDEMDLRRTAARMELAGRGEEWFPVWMGNFVVHSLTAMHAEVSTESRAGSSGSAGGGSTPTGHRSGGPPPPPPPPRVSVSRPAPRTNASDTSAAPSPSPAAASSPPQGLRCYTLESYSEMFLQAPRKTAKTAHLFSCGTRVHDLRTEDRADVLAACKEHTLSATTPTGVSGGSKTHSASRFPTLRVVLTASEEKRHRDIQPVNTVTQRIPLLRVNDDYCDCLDGTDELLTNACSMSGPLAPAAGSRWKSYLVSNQAIQLYDTPDSLEQADMEARGTPGTHRKRGDVGDRLYVSQGPVLPFVCVCGGSVRQLLAPSLVGDGVVDCCEAEDEAAMPYSPFAAPPLFSHNTPPVEEAYAKHVAAEKARVLRLWKQRQAAVATQLVTTASYADPLFPFLTSARALLVERGYYSLFSAEAVRQARVAAATALRDLYTRGHTTQRLRVQKGWERLGQGLTENRTQLQMEVANVTQQLEELERFVHAKLEEHRTNNPIEAGVPMEMLQQHDRLAHVHQGMQMELQHLVMTNLHHAYGDHYEYYPLVRRILPILDERVTDSATPADLYSGIAQDRARRHVTPSQLEQLAMAYRHGGDVMGLLHIDNISASHHGIELMRHTMVAQRFGSAEAPYVARQLGLVPRGSNDRPFDPHVFDNISDPFLRAPVLPIGAWQPYHAERSGRAMQLADPAGDVHLPRRACVKPTSPLYRGGGRLQYPTRHPEPPRSVTLADEEQEKKSLKDKLKAAADGAASTAKRIEIPHHFHLPSVFAVDRYMGPVRCDPDPLSAESSHRHSLADDGDPHAAASQQQQMDRTVQTYTTFLCDTKDRVLFWGRNGKCTQEVIIGTPSACTAWAVKVARDALKELTPQATVKSRDDASVKETDGLVDA